MSVPSVPSFSAPQTIQSRSAFCRRLQARRNLAQNLIVVCRDRPLHMNPGSLHSRFLRQPLELSLQKNFQLLRRQDRNLYRCRVAASGLDLYAIWGLEFSRFQCQAIPPFVSDERGRQKWKHFSLFAAPREIRRCRGLARTRIQVFCPYPA